MKLFKFNVLLLWLPLLGLLIACTDDEDPTPKGQFSELISGMEKMDNIGSFTELFKVMNKSDLKENEELTVFAFTNKAFTDYLFESQNSTRASISVPAPDGVMERHIVKGKYTLEELKKKSSLPSIGQSTLTIEVNDKGNVLVNGVELKKENILSEYAIYTVDQVIPDTEEIPQKQEYIFRVYQYEVSEDGSVINKVPANNAEIILYDEDQNELLELRANAEGIASLAGPLDKYAGFRAYSENSEYSNIYNGWLVTGVFESQEEIDTYHAYADGEKYIGGPILADMDGDGYISDSDKVDYASLNEDIYTIEVIMVAVPTSVVEPGCRPDMAEAIKACRKSFITYHDFYQEYSNDFATLSQREKLTSSDSKILNFFTASYKLIREVNLIVEAEEEYPELYEEYREGIWLCRAHRAQAYLYLSQFYGDVPLVTKVLSLSDDFNVPRAPMDEVQDFVRKELEEARIRVDKADLKEFTEDLIIFYLWMGEYQLAAELCKYTMDAELSISDAIYLYGAEADLVLQQNQNALQLINIFNDRYERAPLTDPQVNPITYIWPLYTEYKLGNPIANNLRWGVMEDWKLQYRLLPIPINEINSNPKMTQNPGW